MRVVPARALGSRAQGEAIRAAVRELAEVGKLAVAKRPRVRRGSPLEQARASQGRTETDDVGAILKMLKANRVRAWRMNTGALLAEHKGKSQLVRFGERGMADILFMWKGGFLRASSVAGITGERHAERGVAGWIEVKAPGARTDRARAAAQAKFRREMLEAGCIHIAVDPKAKETALEQVQWALDL